MPFGRIFFFFFQAEDGIRDHCVTGVQTCALPIFGLDPSAIGSTFNINGVPCTIAGVTPPGFYGDTLRSDPPDFWLPLVAEPNDRLQNAKLEWLYLMGRLKLDSVPGQVQARLTGELHQWLNGH